MHVTTDVQTVKKALTTIKPAISKRGNLPVLSGARFEAKDGHLTVTGSDFNLTIQTDVSAEIVEDGVAIVPHAQLTKLLKGKGPLELKTDGDNIAIRNGSLTTVRTLPAEEFVRMPGAPDTSNIIIPLDLEALSIVLAAPSHDETRPILTGVYFHGNDIVATDSYRLHVVADPDANYPDLLIPWSALAPVVKNGAPAFLHVGPTVTKTRKADNGEKRWLDPSGQPTSRQFQYGHDGQTESLPNPAFKEWEESYEAASEDVSITSGSTTWTSRLIEGEFPNYGQLIPKPGSYPHTITFDRDEMVHAVESLKPMCEKATPIRLNLTDASPVVKVTVIVTDVGEGTAEANLAAPWEGADFSIGLNPGFFIDALEASVSEKVEFTFIDGLKPVIMAETLGARTSQRLLMPVRIGN